MKKVFNAFKIILPILIVMIIALVIATLTSMSNVGDGTLEDGLEVIIYALLGIIPIMLFGGICLALFIIELCLCLVKNKKGSIIASLVFLVILAPILIFYVVLSLSILYEAIHAAIIAVITLLIFITAFVLSCILTKNLGKISVTYRADSES